MSSKLNDKKQKNRKIKVLIYAFECRSQLMHMQATDVVAKLKATLKATVTTSLEKEKETLTCDTELIKLAEGMMAPQPQSYVIRQK